MISTTSTALVTGGTNSIPIPTLNNSNRNYMTTSLRYSTQSKLSINSLRPCCQAFSSD